MAQYICIQYTYANKGPNQAVGYCEVIIPKMETSLNFFKGVQDLNTPEVSFSYLNIIKNSLRGEGKSAVNCIRPLIVYTCNFCELSFKEDAEIMRHLQEMHKMDPNVLCIKCKKSFSVGFLTSVRWKHVCLSGTVSQQPNKQISMTLK